MIIETEKSKCCVCGSDDARYRFSAIDRLHGVPGTYHYVECRRCKLLYINPRVASQSLNAIYPQNYSPHLAAPRIGSDNEVAMIERKSLVRSILRPWLDRLSYHLVFRLLYSLKGMRLDKRAYAVLNNRSRVLDVGCGSGSYLNLLRSETGTEVCGIDIASNAVQTAKARYGLTVFEGDITSYPKPEKLFDLIIAWWYLEHVANPEEVVARMAALLRPGGILVLGVPNARSLNRYVFRGRWYHLDCPRHFNLWTKPSLRALCQRFSLEYFKSACDRTPWGLLGSLQYVVFGSNHHPRTKNLLRGNPLLVILLLPLTFLISLCGGSDIMTLYFEKKSAARTA